MPRSVCIEKSSVRPYEVACTTLWLTMHEPSCEHPLSGTANVRCTRSRLPASIAVAVASLAGLAGLARPASARQAPEACEQRLLAGIPSRSVDAPSGSEFASRVRALSGAARDELAAVQLLAGDVPQFLRHLVPVTLRGAAAGKPVSVTVCVLPDYLALGSNADYLFVPMGLEAALEVSGRFGFVLPTPKLVDAIYAKSAVKLDPQPLAPSDEMRSTAYVVYHTQLINLQRESRLAPLGVLTSGDKKDLVLSERLWRIPGRVAIYGWHRAWNQPIQPLSTVHGARYADYSHGVRLVSRTVYVNGAARKIENVLSDPALAPLLTREGPMPHLLERLSALREQLSSLSPHSLTGAAAARD
jgi:hypothetical protein